MIATDTDTHRTDPLDDPLFAIDLAGGEAARWSLPEILAHMLTGHEPVRSYPGLAAEQAGHWHRFLVRCAAKALHELSTGTGELVGADVGALVADLRGTLVEAAGSADAWRVWHEDQSVPAFLQPPLSGRQDLDDAGYRRKPIGDLTALIGSKEFERKSEAVRYMTVLEVVYALIEFQGGVIFGGRGNYETQLTPSRSGKGSGVPFMGIRFPNASDATFRHDVGVLLDRWERTRDESGLRGEIWALWTEPWDGQTSLPAAQLDPAFIPTARLIRLGRPDAEGRFETLYFKASKASRVADHTDGAMLGDPFTPSVPHPKKDGQFKVRGVLETGFSYPEVAELLGLGEKGAPSPSVQAFFEQAGSASVPAVEVVFDGVAFEQGKTLGYFRRGLPLPVDETTALLLAEPDPLRRAHREMLEMIRRTKTLLRSASRIVLHGDLRPGGRDEAVVEQAPAWLDLFADDSDRYFRFLFEAAAREAKGDDAWQLEWADVLRDWARTAFERALPGLPAPGAQRLAREMNALDYLEWKLRELGAGETEEGATARGAEGTEADRMTGGENA